jgi:hypothetical protein
VITLASTQKRLVQLEALMQARRERERQRELETALDGLDTEHVFPLLIWVFLSRDADPEDPPAVDWDDFVTWLRGGLRADQLPPQAQPAWQHVLDLARRALAGESVPELADMYDWLMQDRAGTARDWR